VSPTIRTEGGKKARARGGEIGLRVRRREGEKERFETEPETKHLGEWRERQSTGTASDRREE
jgi:hypothetical protein